MNLFDNTTVNGMALKNRFIRSALWMKAAESDGHLNDSIYNIYEELAQGGTGLIITGYAYISDEEQPNPGMMGIYDNSFIEEYKNLTDKVHSAGSKIALQIVFGGSQSHHPDRDKMNIFGPSDVENRVTGLCPKAASKEDVKRIVKMFGDAAARAKAAGFDAVQIHGAHGYFLSSFLTPYYNRRTDEYNGDIHSRARIIYETYEEVRNRVGKGFPVMIKLNFDDFMDEDEGLVFEDALKVFKRLDEMGMDLFEVSATNESSGKGLAPARTKIARLDKQSYFRDATAKIAETVGAPVILMGGNRNVERMTDILNNTKIRYVSLARPLLCEPDLVNTWAKTPGYRPKCVSCNQCWISTPNTCVLKETKN
jgi:2,4-dienoyl-CoA reductase-like NADH-dependent reductase (Old Yellow Enzyme family)